MTHGFSLGQDRCAVLSDPSLREEIQRHTASSGATDQILRSLGHFGSDPSILRFEMSPVPAGRGARYDAASAWSVRAVREGRTPEAAEGGAGDSAGL